MCELLQDMTHNARHRPDVVTYSTIIKGLCDRGAMKLAAQLFDDIPRRGVEPDVVAYNTLLEVSLEHASRSRSSSIGIRQSG